MIEQTSDVDLFQFTTSGGNVTFAIDPVALRPNLNVLATLRDSGGSAIATSDSTSSLSASFDVILSGGTYYLEVDGTGTGSPLSSSPTGYTEYGSLGQYTVAGSLPSCTPDLLLPGVPEGLSANPSGADTWIDLEWTGTPGSDDTVGFFVYRDDEMLASTTATSYRDDAVVNNVSYEYYIVAYDDCAEQSGPSATVSASVQGVDRATADVSTVYGSSSGGHQATWSQDDSYQTLTETHSGGRPSRRSNRAEHIWQFNLTGGNTVFNIDAHFVDGGDADDAFEFEWSTSATGGWQPVLSVVKTSDDDGLQSTNIAGPTGTIYIRAYDNDRTGDGSYSYDTLRVDQMFFDGGAPPTGPPGQASNPSPIPGATNVATGVTLSWDAASEATSYDVCIDTESGPTACTNVPGTSYDPGGLAAAVTHYWRVDPVNAAGTTTGTEWTFTTAAPSTTMEATIVLSAQSAGKGKKYAVATVTVRDSNGNALEGVSVDGSFTGDFTDEPAFSSTTGPDGSVTFITTASIKKPSFGFCLDGVALDGFTWDGAGACTPPD